MLDFEAFLKQECENVEKLLDHALRFDYGPSGSEEFYEQCQLRMAVVHRKMRLLPSLKPTLKIQMATEIASLLSKLSELIVHIERAHIGEFSWACGEAFRRHAEKVCTEYPPSEDAADVAPAAEARKQFRERLAEGRVPLFFILADGGITSYRIRSWHAEADLTATRRMFTITVPTSLRHHVLLHAVLGHELGHAASNLANQGQFMTRLVKALTAGSMVGDTARLLSWNLTGFPELPYVVKVPQLLNNLVKNWMTEVACDIFGLALMGPSFAGAMRTLFDGSDPQGIAYGAKHPSHAWRFAALARAYRALGWDKVSDGASASLQAAIESFNATTLKYDGAAAHADEVFAPNVIEDATRSARDFLNEGGLNAAYTVPAVGPLEQLYGTLMRLRPPVGQDFKSKDGAFLPGIDYRHVLHVGWLAQHGKPEDDLKQYFNFFTINRLCEQAIIQLEAVRIPPVNDVSP